VLKTSRCEARLQVAGLGPARSLGLATAGRPGLLQVGKLRCHCRFWSTGFPAGVGSRCKRNRPGGGEALAHRLTLTGGPFLAKVQYKLDGLTRKRLEVATGTNPPGFAIPNPYPWKIFTPIKKPVPMTGLKFCPNTYPSGLRVPTGYPRVFISNMLILFIINKYRND
jgi:hypothetical protein